MQTIESRPLSLALFILGLCAFLCATAFSGDIEDVEGGTIIHLAVVGLPTPGDTSPSGLGISRTLEEFRKQFPRIFAERYRDKYKADPEKYGRHNWDNVEVRLRPFTGIQVEGVETDLLAIAGGMAPDVLHVNFRKSDTYIQNGFLYPLDKPEDGYLSAMTEEEIAFQIYPKLWPVIKRRGPGGKEHVWMFPVGGALGKVLLYRKDLFDANGLDYPDANWTWDDLLEACKRITNPDRGIYGLTFGRGKHESWHWVTFLWSAGGEVMEYLPEENRWECVFNSEAGAKALDFYTRICTERWETTDGRVRRGYASKDTSEVSVKWERGEIGMMFSYIDEKLFATLDPEVTGMAPVPLGPTGNRGGEINNRMFGLYSQIEQPAVRDAAWEYIRFYDGVEATEIKTRILVQQGLGQFVNPRYLRMFGYHDVERLAPKGWNEVFEIAMETGRPEPYGTNSNLAYDMMTLPLQQAEQLALQERLPEDPQERLQVMRELLDAAAERAGVEMIGLISPEERTKRRVAAVIALILLAGGMGTVFRKIFKAFARPVPPGGNRKGKWRRNLTAYIILIPALGSILVWAYVPLLRGAAMAFYDYRIIGESVWVGVDNFGDLLFDGYWWSAVYNSLRYSLYVISLTFLPPVALAILLQEVPRGKILFRTLFYLPAVITGIIITLLWKQFYDPSDNGTLNALVMRIPSIGFILFGLFLLTLCLLFARRLWLQGSGIWAWGCVAGGLLLLSVSISLVYPLILPQGESIWQSIGALPGRLFSTLEEPYRWLSNPQTAMLSCVIPMVWAGMGPGCLIYLAALKGIPDDYYEAAEMDGANFVDKILFIVVPTLKPLLIINFVGVFIGSWYGAMGNILVMTGGAANTEVADLHIWYKAFTFLKFGPATAMAWVLGFMLIGFTLHQLRILSRVEFKAQGVKE